MRFAIAFAAILLLAPGCGTTFGTITLIQSGIEAGATIVKGGAPAEEGGEKSEIEPGGD